MCAEKCPSTWKKKTHTDPVATRWRIYTPCFRPLTPKKISGIAMILSLERDFSLRQIFSPINVLLEEFHHEKYILAIVCDLSTTSIKGFCKAPVTFRPEVPSSKLQQIMKWNHQVIEFLSTKKSHNTVVNFKKIPQLKPKRVRVVKPNPLRQPQGLEFFRVTTSCQETCSAPEMP